jgi:hypothetical protein
MYQWHNQSLQYSILAIDQLAGQGRFVIIQQPRLETDWCPSGLPAKRGRRDLYDGIVPDPLYLSRLVIRSDERTTSFDRNVDRSGHRVSVPAICGEKDGFLANEGFQH